MLDIKKFKLQYITNENAKYSHIESAKLVLAGGCKWIQLRMKNVDASLLLKTAEQLGKLCKQYDATFIVNDNAEVAKLVDADGVHLGKNDMPIREARNILGENKIIGATANTAEDIENAINEGANYIGLGPYKFTTTKQNLSSILGINGYKEIFNKLIEIDKLPNINIPVVAIGGIELGDAEDLVKTKIAGIAVSGGILNAENITEQTEKFMKKLEIIA